MVGDEPMDFTKIDLPQLFTLLNFLGMMILGLSDIRKRRAEAKAKESESHLTDAEAASKLIDSSLKMLEPKDKQVSILITKSLEDDKVIDTLEAENKMLNDENLALKEQLAKARIKIECLETKIKGAPVDCDNITGKMTRHE